LLFSCGVFIALLLFVVFFRRLGTFCLRGCACVVVSRVLWSVSPSCRRYAIRCVSAVAVRCHVLLCVLCSGPVAGAFCQCSVVLVPSLACRVWRALVARAVSGGLGVSTLGLAVASAGLSRVCLLNSSPVDSVPFYTWPSVLFVSSVQHWARFNCTTARHLCSLGEPVESCGTL